MPCAMWHRTLFARTALFVVVSASLLSLSSLPADAHAIVELQGSDAIAGRTSTLSLEVQHGCITGGGGTVKVVAQFGAPFGRVTAGAVPGWTSLVTPGTTAKSSSGRTVTWSTNGVAQPFATPLFLALTVHWPKRAGGYGIVVSQFCTNPTEQTIWDTPIQPTTVGVPFPPVTPLATVCVLPQRLANSSSSQAKRAIAQLCATVR